VADTIAAAERGEVRSSIQTPSKQISKPLRGHRRASPAETEGSGSYHTAFWGSDSVSSQFEEGFEEPRGDPSQILIQMTESASPGSISVALASEFGTSDRLSSSLSVVRPTHSRASTSTVTGEASSNPLETSSTVSNSSLNGPLDASRSFTSPILRRIFPRDSAILDSGPSSPLSYGSPGDGTIGTGITASRSLETVDSVRTASTGLSSISDCDEDGVYGNLERQAARDRAAAYYEQGALGVDLGSNDLSGPIRALQSSSEVFELVSDELGIYPSPSQSGYHQAYAPPIFYAFVDQSHSSHPHTSSDKKEHDDRMSRTANWLQTSLSEDPKSAPSPLEGFYDSVALLRRRKKAYPLLSQPEESEWDRAIGVMTSYPCHHLKHRLARFVIKRHVSEMPSFDSFHQHESLERENRLHSLSAVDLEEFVGVQSARSSEPVWITHSSESPVKTQRYLGARKPRSKASKMEKANQTLDSIFPAAAASNGSDSEREDSDPSIWKVKVDTPLAISPSPGPGSRPSRLLGLFNGQYNPSERFELSISPTTTSGSVPFEDVRDDGVDLFSYEQANPYVRTRRDRTRSEHVHSLMNRFHNGSAGDRQWTANLESLGEVEVEGIDQFFAASEEQWRNFAGDEVVSKRFVIRILFPFKLGLIAELVSHSFPYSSI